MELKETAIEKPSNNGEVLVYDKHGGWFVGWYNEKADKWNADKNFVQSDSYIESDVVQENCTHWMELPPKPEYNPSLREQSMHK